MIAKLKQDIIADLEKSGFSSELRSIRTFIKNDWHCTGFANYLDLDHEHQQIRAIDLRAIRTIQEDLPDGSQFTLEYRIEGEVKKSKTPWVVFKEQTEDAHDTYIHDLTHISGISQNTFQAVLSKYPLHTNLGWRAYGIHESFKAPDTKSRAYSSFITVCKSAESVLELASTYYGAPEEGTQDLIGTPERKLVVIIKPIIILDGDLFTAVFSEAESIDIEKVPFAPVEVMFRSKHCRKGVYLVDIVSINNLSEYIDRITERQKSIFDALVL